MVKEDPRSIRVLREESTSSSPGLTEKHSGE